MVILVLFLVLAFSGFLSLTGKFFNYIGRPIWKTRGIMANSSADLGYLVRTKLSVFRENKKLQEENSFLKTSMIDYQIIKNENEKLKELLNNLSRPNDFVLAGILVKPNYSPYDTLIVDVGSEDKVTVGLKVYIDGKIPIGEVVEVNQKTSLIELYSNPGKITTGVIDGSNVSVDLIGRGGSNFEMLVPYELIVPDQAIITLPGIQSEVLAIVENEIGEPTDPVKKIILRSPINIQNQKWVQIKKN